ncbi:transposase-like protein, IS1239 [Streptococcus pneumoniae]|nr:transposase-like protein, IS1239 [Streptococcus pneumoniae]
MEESINPIISIGPVIFNLTMLAMTLLIVGVIFVFIYWASRNMTLKPKGVAFIEKWINNYPKKCLDYKSPREDFWMANLNLKFSVRNKSRNRFKFCRSFKYPARRCSWC